MNETQNKLTIETIKRMEKIIKYQIEENKQIKEDNMRLMIKNEILMKQNELYRLENVERNTMDNLKEEIKEEINDNDF